MAALLNKEKASGGGAKRSTEQAALGGKKTNNGSKLSQSEMDALRGQVARCWNIPAGAWMREPPRFGTVQLDPSGALEGSPEINSGGRSSGVNEPPRRPPAAMYRGVRPTTFPLTNTRPGPT